MFEAAAKIEPGMKIEIPVNSIKPVAKKIDSIEYLLKDGQEYIGVCLRYTESVEIEALKSASIEEESCDIYSA